MSLPTSEDLIEMKRTRLEEEKDRKTLLGKVDAINGQLKELLSLLKKVKKSTKETLSFSKRKREEETDLQAEESQR